MKTLTRLPKLSENKFLEDKVSDSITVKTFKNGMHYYKIESNLIFCKILDGYTEAYHKSSGSINSFDYDSDTSLDADSGSGYDGTVDCGQVRNNNYCPTAAVNITFNDEEACQMYNLKQMTYGKKFVKNFMVTQKKFPEIDRSKYKLKKEKKITKKKMKENTYLKAIESIKRIHRPVFDPPCPWLEKRLYIEDLCESDADWEDVAVTIRENMINLANDICIFFTSQSHFVFTMIKVEAYNLLRLLSLPCIQDYNSRLSSSLLKNLLKLINQDLTDSFLTFQEMRDLSKDMIWNYYKYPNPHAMSLKFQLKDRPKILYYSMWIKDECVPGIKSKQMDTRFVRIERNFFCKIILRRNLAALSNKVEGQINETLFEIYLDYNKGRFSLALANINHVIRKHDTRIIRDFLSYQCMVSFVSKEFFCCEEVLSLYEREYVMDNMSHQFVKLMHWLRTQRIGHFIV